MKNIYLLLIILLPLASFSQSYNFLGTYTEDGTPEYFDTPDQVNSSTVELIDNALPEGYAVPDFNPHYISSGYDTDISLNEDAEVWVTFVKEGAGYKNVLGFYTYETANPPTTAPAPENITIIFPNVSAENSGGSLKTGDKVKLGSFTAGTSIGWVLLADGWNGTEVTAGNWQLYSNPAFNPEDDDELKYHNVLLADPDNEQVVLGFEDVRRDSNSCDNDFNDALFYVTSDPYTAIKDENLNDIDSGNDVTSGNDGGLESNGNLASLIAQRNFNRSKNHTSISSKFLQTKFSKTRKSNLKSAKASSLENYLPESGMYGTEKAYVSSPQDLIGVTNAEHIFSVDYYQEENRVSVILATETNGSIYDHTKVVCDRLNSSTLEDVRTVSVRGHQIISTKIKRASGVTENSIGFSIRKGETQNELYSYWNTEQYPEGDYYNFQIWGSSFSQVFALANQVIDSFSSEKELVSTNSDNRTPEVFVKSGHYSQGKLYLDIVNKSAVKNVSLQGNLTTVENATREPIQDQLALSGDWNESVTVSTGNLFDIGFSMWPTEGGQPDVLYFSDGPWGTDYSDDKTIVNEFNITNNPVEEIENTYPIERQPALRGETKGTVNLFRQVLPGSLSMDVRDYNSLEFSLASSHPVEVVLMTDDLTNWDNRLRKTITPGEDFSPYYLSFDDFTDKNGETQPIENVSRIVFSLTGSSDNYEPFFMEVKNVAFAKTSQTSAEDLLSKEKEQLLLNYPNPFSGTTTIVLPNPSKKVSLKVYDTTGKLVDMQHIDNNYVQSEVQYQSPGLSNGLYKVVVLLDSGKLYFGEFMIQR